MLGNVFLATFAQYMFNIGTADEIQTNFALPRPLLIYRHRTIGT